MMFYFTSLVVSLVVPTAAAGDTATSVAFNDLSSDAPVSQVTGIASSEIQRPTTPRALAVATSGAFQGQTIAFEVGPYWMLDHPSLTQESYLHPKFGASIIRDFAISAGVVPGGGTGTAATLNGKYGVGARTTLVSVLAQDAIKECTDINEAAAAINDTLTKKLSDELAASGAQLTPEAIQKKMDELVEKELAKEPKLSAESIAKCTAGIVARKGFLLTASGAFGGDVTAATSNWAAWVTPTYVASDKISWMFVARFTGDSTASAPVGALGTKFQWADDKASLAGEVVLQKGLDSTRPLGGQVDISAGYLLADDLTFSATFGGTVDGSNPLAIFSLANLKIDFGKSQNDRVSAATTAARDSALRGAAAAPAASKP